MWKLLSFVILIGCSQSTGNDAKLGCLAKIENTSGGGCGFYPTPGNEYYVRGEGQTVPALRAIVCQNGICKDIYSFVEIDKSIQTAPFVAESEQIIIVKFLAP